MNIILFMNVFLTKVFLKFLIKMEITAQIRHQPTITNSTPLNRHCQKQELNFITFAIPIIEENS